MDGLKSYALAFVTVCICAGIVTQLAPDGADLTDSGSAEEKLTDIEKKAVEESIKKLIAAKFSISSDDLTVSLTLDTKNISAIEITAIDVVIKGKAECAEIKKYLDEMFYGTAKVSVTEVFDG